MKPPSSITEFRQFMGMVNQMSKFSPNIAQISKPLRKLLSSKNTWTWTASQEESFIKLKQKISSPKVLALYDVSAKTKISADVSAYGLGAVLLQQHQERWRPVVFASRALSETETYYAQIEKDALALTWALEKFAEYVLGKIFILETDHKPLVPLVRSEEFRFTTASGAQIQTSLDEVSIHNPSCTRKYLVYSRHVI